MQDRFLSIGQNFKTLNVVDKSRNVLYKSLNDLDKSFNVFNFSRTHTPLVGEASELCACPLVGEALEASPTMGVL